MDDVLLIGESLAADTQLEQLLEREGWRVARAEGKTDGIRIIHDRQPGVVIVDQHVAGDDGLTLLKEIRALAPSSEAILVTDGGEVEVAIEVLRAGALDYLRRPIDGEQLRVALGRARERGPQRRSLNSPTVLVVDDHEPTRKRLVRVLEKEDYQVLSASDGEEGLRLFQENRVDLILADLRMPRVDGLALLEATKGQGADVEVIVITGYGDEDSVVGALRQGAINFLRKPVDIEQMLLAIQKALEHQTTRRSLAYRNRDVEIMQEMVVRLTRELEVVVETPQALSREAVGFLHQFVDALPLGIVVASGNREVLYANRHIAERLGKSPEVLSAEWLREVGLGEVTDAQLEDAYQQAIHARPGAIETLVLSKWAFLVMTPIKLIRPDGTQKFVALAVRGERKASRG
jgi:DNA-binding NtrC family response regulator